MVCWGDMSETGRKVAAFCASLGVTVALLAALEIGVRLMGLQPSEWPAAGERVRFPGIQVDPLLGPMPRPGWAGQWMDDFEVRVDDHGFRTTGLVPTGLVPRGHAPTGQAPTGQAPKWQAPLRIAFLGDSCTFGWGIDTVDTFVARLDARQRHGESERFEFLNAAYPGQSAVSGIYMLRERVLPLHPDLVILGFSAHNAFRFSLVSDADRFRFFALRKTLLRSRLFHLLAAWLANYKTSSPHPRDRQAIVEVPVTDQRRVAAANEFEEALRIMVAEARESGASVLFLVFPRASEVSTEFQAEDVSLVAKLDPTEQPAAGREVSLRDLDLLELSCLDHRQLEDPIRVLNERLPQWQPVYPTNPAVRRLLRRGADVYVNGAYATAVRRFAEAVDRQPESPLARYDLGVAQLAAGDKAAGLDELAEADRLACNVFLHYQALVWQVATELAVPVVDLTMHFQAHDGASLFLDAAHPNPVGQRLIAEALWPAVTKLLPAQG